MRAGLEWPLHRALAARRLAGARPMCCCATFVRGPARLGLAGLAALLVAGCEGPQAGEQAVGQTHAESRITLSVPAMVGPLTLNPQPLSLAAGDLGPIYVSGVVSGLAMEQNHASPGDDGTLLDSSNAQVILQKPEGPFQYYVQAGAYSLPALGTPYVRAADATDDFYGEVPTAFVKVAPEDGFSVQAGALPTLFGAESTFTFENMNIERGLLWNQ